MSTSWLHPRDELVETMRRIYRYKMTTTSGGNLSVLDPDGGIWITPSRVDKGGLQPRDIVCVQPDGTHTGLHQPSSEFPFHREIYRRRPDLKAIVHAHPSALVAFSICRRLPDTRVQSHAYNFCGKVAYAAYACPGSQELGDRIAAAFAGGADCVMLENHGVVIGGGDLGDAFQRFETLEFVAQTLVRAATLGSIQVLPPEYVSLQSMPELKEFDPGVPSNAEKELRSQLCAFVQRAYQQRLLISTAGAFSARLDAAHALISPRRRDRLSLEPSSIVRIGKGSSERGRHPSRAARLHALIYEKNPEIGAIINAQPVNASAFCMTKAAFSTRTIPESYVVLNDVPKLPFARLVEDAETIASQVSLSHRPALMIENEGVLVVGRNILEAFDRLEVLEATSEALIMSRPLGPLVEMPEEVIAELRKVFGVS